MVVGEERSAGTSTQLPLGTAGRELQAPAGSRHQRALCSAGERQARVGTNSPIGHWWRAAGASTQLLPRRRSVQAAPPVACRLPPATCLLPTLACPAKRGLLLAGACIVSEGRGSARLGGCRGGPVCAVLALCAAAGLQCPERRELVARNASQMTEVQPFHAYSPPHAASRGS